MTQPTRKEYNSWKAAQKHMHGYVCMTFEEYFDVWVKSGHWEQRGREHGQYQLARVNTSIAMSYDNVQVIRIGYDKRVRGEYNKAPKQPKPVKQPREKSHKYISKPKNYQLIDLREYAKQRREENERRSGTNVGNPKNQEP